MKTGQTLAGSGWNEEVCCEWELKQFWAPGLLDFFCLAFGAMVTLDGIVGVNWTLEVFLGSMPVIYRRTL